MWHQSYGVLAAQQLDEWRAEAACLRSSVSPRTTQPGRAGLRVLLGRGLVRLGERLAGAPARPALR